MFGVNGYKIISYNKIILEVDGEVKSLIFFFLVVVGILWCFFKVKERIEVGGEFL